MEAVGEGGIDEVRAAGGVIIRDGRVAVVHRPKYDDWSLPKGKCDTGESDEACALREVEEETGLRCDLGAELTATRYRDAKGRPKRVRWWLMRPVSGDFWPTEEVDELRWLTPAAARALLSYPRDVVLLDEL
jgi:8-oxo-dGTP diphosphatase